MDYEYHVTNQMCATLAKLQKVKTGSVQHAFFEAYAGMWGMSPMRRKMDAAYVEGANLAVQLWFRLHTFKEIK